MGCGPSNSKIEPREPEERFVETNPVVITELDPGTVTSTTNSDVPDSKEVPAPAKSPSSAVDEQKVSNLNEPGTPAKLSSLTAVEDEEMYCAPTNKKGQIEDAPEAEEIEVPGMSYENAGGSDNKSLVINEVTQNDDETEEDQAGESSSEVKLKSLDTLEKIETYTKEKFAEVTAGISSNARKEDITKPVEKLNQLYRTLSKRANGQVGQFGGILDKLKLVSSVKSLLEIPRDEYFENPLHKNISGLLTLLWNTSDCSKDICSSVTKDGLHCTIISQLSKQPELQVEKLKDSEGKQLLKPIGRVKAFFAVLYNTLRIQEDSRRVIRKEGIVPVCLKFLSTSLLNIKAKALLVLAFAADLDESSDVIAATESNMRFIVLSLLEGAIKLPSHRGTKYGYTVEELMQSLSRLAMNKNNGLEMIKLDIITHCNSVLIKKFSEEEVKWTLELLWSLCFLEETHAKVRERDEMIERVRELTKHPRTEISKPAHGILFEIEGAHPSHYHTFYEYEKVDIDDDEKLPEPDIQEERHIMISYCWKQQPAAIRILQKLRQKGHKVWIDIEKMEGDSVEKMADAIENSSYVICCFSEDYSQSQACRSEATYAYKQKKNLVFAKVQQDFEPKGWLGLILGAEIYYHLFDESQFETHFDKMISYIKDKDAKVQKSDVQQLSSQPGSSGPIKGYIQPSPDPKGQNSASNWSEEEVAKWIQLIGIQSASSVIKTLKGMNGEQLMELFIWQNQTPAFFLDFCQKTLKLQNPMDLIKFSTSVRKLK